MDKKKPDFRQNDESVEIHKKGLKNKNCTSIICDIKERQWFEKEESGMYGNLEEILNPVTCGNAALGCFAAVSAATDLYCGKVYNIITIPALCLGSLLAVQRYGAMGLLDILCAAGFTVMLLSPFYRAGGLGAGDIKLLAAVSAFMPAEDYLRCFAGAFLIGAGAGILRLLLTKGRGHTIHMAVPVAVSVMIHLAGFY